MPLRNSSQSHEKESEVDTSNYYKFLDPQKQF